MISVCPGVAWFPGAFEWCRTMFDLHFHCISDDLHHVFHGLVPGNRSIFFYHFMAGRLALFSPRPCHDGDFEVPSALLKARIHLKDGLDAEAWGEGDCGFTIHVAGSPFSKDTHQIKIDMEHPPVI